MVLANPRRSLPVASYGYPFGSTANAADVAALIQDGAEVKKVVGDCKFTEGPAYSPKGFLVFSDIPNSRIVRVDDDGAVSDFLKPSGNSNGLMFDAAGHLYVCQGGARRVVRIGAVDGKIETLCEQFEGKKLNSPNDVALDYAGGLYFTDPRYGYLQALVDAQAITDVSTDQVVSAKGELDTIRYGAVLNTPGLVDVRGAGESYDGRYYIPTVTHTLRRGAYRQAFTLTREGTGSTVSSVTP